MTFMEDVKTCSFYYPYPTGHLYLYRPWILRQSQFLLDFLRLTDLTYGW